MVRRTHSYEVTVTWTGNLGTGTSAYRAYSRNHDVTVSETGQQHDLGGSDLPEPIAGSSDPAFRGEASRWNPEQMLTAALSQCHMLAYLHLCAAAGVVVTAYKDHATGTMAEDASGGGRFAQVVLRPKVTVSSAEEIEKATALHSEAHAKCFVASSVNFPVLHEPVVASSGS